MNAVDDVRDSVPPGLAELVVLAAIAALAVIGYWAERRYRRWAEEASPFAAPRARVAAYKTTYRRRRSGVAEASQVIGEVMRTFDELRSRRP